MTWDRFTARLVAALEAHLTTGTRPDIPEGAAPLWGAFCDLCDTRTWHANDPNPISWSEMAAWKALHRWPLEPHHARAIRKLDDAWLTCFHAKARGEGDDGQPRPSGPLIPSAFDAMVGGN